MKMLAIIPARSGSKGLKDKNIKELMGKPLLAYSILAAKDSNLFSNIHVSTDSKIYKDIAIKYGADVPFLRSNKLSLDTSSTWDVVLEVINNYLILGYSFDYICLLQPTSPLRQYTDIINAYNILISNSFDSIVSAVAYEHPVEWGFEEENGKIKSYLFDMKKDLPRQECKRILHENGAIYMFNCQKFLQNKDIYKGNVGVYIMNQYNSVDIDTIEDFNYAEYILRKREM